MFRKALTSVGGIAANKRFYFVIRQQHVDEEQLDSLIKDALPEAKIIVLPEMTRGAAETALTAAPQLNSEDGLIIMDCDLWFQSASYNHMVEASLEDSSDIAGGLLTFTADNPRYSYAKFGDDNIVTETAEKQVISNHAITGAYFFARAQEFIDSAKTLIEQPVGDKMPEYYLSLLYNILIHDGKKIQAATVDEYASFGTPEELTEYQTS
jgi:dTDP-glucose pyrophosphorylase